MVYVDAKQELSFLDPPKLEIFSSVECLQQISNQNKESSSAVNLKLL